MKKFYEDANDQHVACVVGYVDDTPNPAGVYADADLTKLIPADELYRLCCLDRLAITVDHGQSFNRVVVYTESELAIITLDDGEGSYTATPVVIPFAAE